MYCHPWEIGARLRDMIMSIIGRHEGRQRNKMENWTTAVVNYSILWFIGLFVCKLIRDVDFMFTLSILYGFSPWWAKYGGGPNMPLEFLLDSNRQHICLCERTVFDESDSREMVEFGLHYVIGRVQKYEKEWVCNIINTLLLFFVLL